MASDGQDRADALGWGRRPNRPKTFARYHTIPQEVTNVSIYDKGPEPCSKARTPARSLRVLLLQHESNLYIDLVALDVAVLYQDVLVLDPRTFHASKRLGSTSDGLVDGILKARL